MRRFIDFLGIFSGFVLLTILTLMSAEVISRYLFNRPILGTVEISSYLLVIFAFTGMAFTQSRKGHIQVDFVTHQLSQSANRLLRISSLILSLTVFMFVTWQSAIGFWKSWQLNEVRWGALPLPVYPVKFVVAFGSMILCIQFILDIFDELKKRSYGPRAPDAQRSGI
jgi:TRAP-type C4-dicarboxylate transport system permease small subunit